MADEPSVEIGDLVLRIPGLGLDRHDAGRLGEEVAQRLADELPRWRLIRQPAMLELRIQVPAHVRRDELAKAIAVQILRALQ
jgi:hypothetical protein